jgi:metal-sulfur cluster biosynthetic enzyme
MNESGLQHTVNETLRAVKYPGYSRDIVSFGIVKGVRAVEGVLTVALQVDSPKPEVAFQIQSEAEAVLRGQPELKDFRVKIEVLAGQAIPPHAGNGHEPPLGPLQDELPHEDAGFDPDPMPRIVAMMRPDLAPGMGYGEDGPDPLGGPTGDRTSTRWTGPVPVFQWEIDPSDSSGLPYGEHETERGGWLFRLWWQVHPADLVYASISAMAQEGDLVRPSARQHPIGRNVAVNLVYDLQRQGVVAIYGTALDFRPFVEVFLEAYGITKHEPQAEATSAERES